MSIDSAMKRLCTDLALKGLPKAVTTVTTAAGVPIPPEVTRIVLRVFIELITEEESNLSERLETLLGSYYNGAIEFLTDSQYIEKEEVRNAVINRARELFSQASKVEEDPLLMVKSKFYIGVCYALQNEKDAAKRWYEMAFRLASERAFQLQSYQPGILAKAVDGVIEPVNAWLSVGPRNYAEAVLTVLTGGPLVWIPVVSGVEIYENRKKRMAAQRQTELERILFFMDSLVPVLQAHGSTLHRNRIEVSGQ